MINRISLKKEVFVKYYDLITLFICLIGICLSIFFMSLGLGMLIGRILIVGDWNEKIKKLKENKKILIILLSFYILHLLSFFWSNNIDYYIYDINKKLPFLVVPIALCFILPVKKNIIKHFIWIYSCIILVGTIWGSINYFSAISPDSRLLIPSVSHIRFSLNICFAIFINIIYLKNNFKSLSLFIRILSIVIVIWFVCYMVFAQYLTGLSILLILISFYLFLLLKEKRSIKRFILIFTYLALVIYLFVWIYNEYKFYFTPNKIYLSPLSALTPDGNKYDDFDINNPTNLIENGNYINSFVCSKELEYEWEKRTGINLYEKEGVFSYKDVIIRYLNSKTPYKDGNSVRKLSDADIENVKNRTPNIVHTEKYSIKPRLYKTFYEIEYYLKRNQIHDLTIIQRFELWLNAKELIRDNFWIGTSSGDIADKFEAKLKERNSQLSYSKMRIHNQFITIFSTFGVLGFILFIFWIFYPAIKLKLFNDYIFYIFFLISIISMFTEDTLDNMSGIMFFICFYSFFIFNHSALSSKKISEKE